MFKFSANYAHTNNNFVVQNIPDVKCRNEAHYAIICVLKNILQRGTPTLPSKYLTEYLGADLMERMEDKLFLIDDEVPNWRNLIKGDDTYNYFPAREFFYKIIPEYLSEFSFIQQLILPEALINEITGRSTSEFHEARVDFYLPQARLVIEIDGEQHDEVVQRQKDKARDKHLDDNGIKTIRIKSNHIKARGIELNKKIQEIMTCLNRYNDILKKYKKRITMDIERENDINTKQSLLATAVIRFQITILKLIESGKLSMDDKIWNLQIIERDVKGFSDIAIEDLFLWLKNLFKLCKLDFNLPKVNIKLCSNISELMDDKSSIKIDFSLLKRWTNDNEQHPDIIFVRNDYYDDKNYFKMSTSDPIKYKIIADGEDSDYPALNFVLENIFGFQEFNPGQLPIIINTLACFDTIGLLPTGSGKSLCYQLVALLQPCISFVVVPIKSLMYDQKYNLDKCKITHTNFISSDQTPEEKECVQKEFSEGRYQFVWISPERFQTKVFRDYLDGINRQFHIGLAVIDEVHCLSEWGHDFRTSYLNLAKTIRKYCPSSTFLGLTATASVNVLKDILIEFEVSRSNVKTLPSFTRLELTFKVFMDDGTNKNGKKNNLTKLLDSFIKKKNVLSTYGNDTRSGIIFTLFVNGNDGCYQLSQELSRKYKSEVNYYSGKVPVIKKEPIMSDKKFNDYKRRTQRDYQDNNFPLLVATKAFGMGIDKSNIRYTIHYGIPGSLEALYQEAGRAGRDKQSAGCYILYSFEDEGKDNLNKVFDLNSTVNDVKEICDQLGFKKRDIFKNIFLWLSDRKSLEEDFQAMKCIIDDCAMPGAIQTIVCKKLSLSLSYLQKIIYKLSIIGIVEDWIISNWDKDNGIIEVSFCNYSDESIKKSLISYIQKYDKNFSLDAENKHMDEYRQILEEDIHPYEKVCKIVLKWQYENIAYSRRQSIKNLADLCENFTDSKQFQKTIEDYFKFTDMTDSFDFIAENPREHKNWFSFLLKKENENDIKLTKSEVESLKVNLSRFLESYRYNMGLNYISGIIRLIQKNYEDQDGRARLQSAFEQINTLPEEDKADIFNKTLEIGKVYMDPESREDLSEMLINNYENAAEKVYAVFQDNYSLNYIVKNASNRLHSIGKDLL